jgi:chitin disaccharide deacetylase
MNRSVTAGIIRGFTHGLLTSTSLLANAPDAEAAIGAWRLLEEQRVAGRLPSAEARETLREPAHVFELGIHLNLTQGRPLTQCYPPQLLDRAGCFCGIGRLFRHLRRRRPAFEPAIRSELSAQIEFLKDRGIQPTHLNGHQYIELLPGLRGTIRGLLTRYGITTLRVARERGLARTTLLNRLAVANWSLAHVKRFYAGMLFREARRWDLRFPSAFFGTSHAGRVDLRLVQQFVASGHGCRLIEIGLHPATFTTALNAEPVAGWEDPLAHHRPQELQMLTSTALVEFLHSRGLALGRLTDPATIARAKAA